MIKLIKAMAKLTAEDIVKISDNCPSELGLEDNQEVCDNIQLQCLECWRRAAVKKLQENTPTNPELDPKMHKAIPSSKEL